MPPIQDLGGFQWRLIGMTGSRALPVLLRRHAAVLLQPLELFAHSYFYFCLLLLRRGVGAFLLVRRAERAFALGDRQ